jgi:hypothetical protein
MLAPEEVHANRERLYRIFQPVPNNQQNQPELGSHASCSKVARNRVN